MPFSLIVIPFLTFVGGVILGSAFVKRRLGKQIRKLISNMNSERKLHAQALQDLTKLFQEEQQSRVKFEVLSWKHEEELRELREDHQKLQVALVKKDSDLVQAHSKRSNAQLKLESANNTIITLNETIEKYKTDVKVTKAND